MLMAAAAAADVQSYDDSSKKHSNPMYLLKIYLLSEGVHNKAGVTEIARLPCPTTAITTSPSVCSRPKCIQTF